MLALPVQMLRQVLALARATATFLGNKVSYLGTPPGTHLGPILDPSWTLRTRPGRSWDAPRAAQDAPRTTPGAPKGNRGAPGRETPGAPGGAPARACGRPPGCPGAPLGALGGRLAEVRAAELGLWACGREGPRCAGLRGGGARLRGRRRATTRDGSGRFAYGCGNALIRAGQGMHECSLSHTHTCTCAHTPTGPMFGHS